DPQTGAASELLARSNVVFTGYWEQPEETAAALDGGWFHTGDGAEIAAIATSSPGPPTAGASSRDASNMCCPPACSISTPQPSSRAAGRGDSPKWERPK
ncbi:AMP-binding protein, partial [Rhodococcus sp. T2V]|uniref:AMP-binding protein n=1 Tax=Rhodococcus sp. T2V TaxID=3034164 RepID=UPI0023E28ADB